jgi:hypothetical protein
MPDDVEVTEADIEWLLETAEMLHSGYHLSGAQAAERLERVARNAARTPVSVEEVARAISDAIWPLADWDGDRCVADAAALKAAEAAIATLSTRP